MSEPTTRYRLHSPRRRGPQGSPVQALTITVIVLIIVLIVVIADKDDVPPSPVAATPSPTSTRMAPIPTPSHTPMPEVLLVESGWVEAEVVMPPTPSPTWPALETASAREPQPGPQPTPSISQCAHYGWTTLQVFTPSAQVKVDIRVDNRCPYDLGPGNLLFEITGWRDGGRVQSVRGTPFETIRRGRTGELSIGLPGSEDWYDEIEVSIFD